MKSASRQELRRLERERLTNIKIENINLKKQLENKQIEYNAMQAVYESEISSLKSQIEKLELNNKTLSDDYRKLEANKREDQFIDHLSNQMNKISELINENLK